VGGLLLGLVVGIVVALFTKKVFNDPMLCINATFVSGFIGFFIAETVLENMGLAISGIMTLISIGLFLSSFAKSNLKEECEHAIH
jgi:NhaP-type Na+/H+ or K+/H+ antiporter